MALVRWNPFGDLENIHRAMDRYFEGSGFEGEAHWTPRVDIFEDDKAYNISVELPGMDQKDVHVNLENKVLSISGERKLEQEKKKDGYARVERFYGSFSRSFYLPDGVDQEKIEAKMDKGVLHVALPKSDEVKPKQIEVKVS